MTTTNATASTAPRDLDSLLKLGRYQLRTLAAEFGGLSNNEEKQAFLSLDTNKQAEAVLALIQAADGGGKSGGKPKAGGAVVRTPVTGKGAGTKAAGTAATGGAAASTDGNPGVNAGRVLELLETILGEITQIKERLDNVEGQNEATQSAIGGVNRLTCVAVSLSLQVSETVLSAPIEGVLQSAIEQIPQIQPILDELLDAPAAGDEGAGEGNGE